MLELHIDEAELRDCFLELPPLELKSFRLFEASETKMSEPAREALREAAYELIQYTKRSSELRQRLEVLTAVPLTVPTVAWCL